MNNIEYILEKLVSFRSYVPYENEAFDFLIPFLRERGFVVKTQRVGEKRYNLLAEKGSSDKSVLFYMHLDTVPPQEDRQTNPLVLSREDDLIKGLGCFDMKGGTAVLLSLLDSISLKDHKLKLVFGIDEEGNSEGVFTLVSSEFIEDVVVAFCPEACIVPSDWRLPIMLTVGGRGRCAFEVNIPGKTRHGAEDKGGVNAIDQAALLVQHLSQWKHASHSMMGESSFFVRSIRAGNEALSLPSVATINIDYQLVPPQTPEGCLVSLRQFIGGLYDKNILAKELEDNLEVILIPRKTPYIEPYYVNADDKNLVSVGKLLKRRYGFIQYDYAKSVADQNVLVVSGIPTLTLGPLGGNVHQAGEWVSLKSLIELEYVYKEILSSY